MKITIWRKHGEEIGELPDLVKGSYQFIFSIPIPDFLPDLSRDLPHVYYTSGGKRFILEGWELRPEMNELVIQVKIVENPIPIALILGAIAGAGLGMIILGWLKEIRKILTSPGADIVLILLIGAVVLGFFKLGGT